MYTKGGFGERDAITNWEQVGLPGEVPRSRHWKGVWEFARWTLRGRLGISQVDTYKNILFGGNWGY